MKKENRKLDKNPYKLKQYLQIFFFEKAYRNIRMQ